MQDQTTATGSVAMIDSKLFAPQCSVTLPAIQGFVAKEKFRENETVDGVKMWGTGLNFDRHFLGKTESDLPETQLRGHILRKNSLDAPILAELGGEAAAETSLAHMWAMMMKQGNGEEGDLLVNGYANIFYVRDSEGTLWAVDCHWRAGRGWCVGASPVTRPLVWYAGRQVFSRDSLLFFHGLGRGSFGEQAFAPATDHLTDVFDFLPDK